MIPFNSIKMPCARILSISIATVAVLAGVLSCKSYDEQDVTIIAYLKVNDLIEQELSQTCEAEISQFEDDYSKHITLTSLGVLGVTDVFYQTFGYNAEANDPILKYDVKAINTFFANFYEEETESFRTDKLEAQISSDLWDYMANLYKDALPAKAQNVEEGSYYTITELKQKYPEYNEVELIDFSPMQILNQIAGENELETLKYRVVIDSHFTDGIPDDLDIDAMYTGDMAGFEKFAKYL